jgi:hypothetical protein
MLSRPFLYHHMGHIYFHSLMVVFFTTFLFSVYNSVISGGLDG